METKTYNGWSTYSTWLVNLWLSNDEGIYQDIVELVASAQETDDPETRLTKELKFYIEDHLLPNALNGTLEGDLIQHAMHDVDLCEIARSWLSEE